MAQSEFDQSIAPAIIPLMPGLSPLASEYMKGPMYKTGTPWTAPGLAAEERFAILNSANYAGNRQSIVKRLELLTDAHHLNWNPNFELGDKSKTERIMMERAGWKKAPNGSWYDPSKWKWSTKLGLIKIGDEIIPPVNIKDYMITDDDLAEMKNKTSNKPKTNIWNRVTGAAKGFLQTPLGRISLATGKLVSASSLPLLLSGELEPDAEFGFDKKNLGLDTWFAKTRWNKKTQQLEKY